MLFISLQTFINTTKHLSRTYVTSVAQFHSPCSEWKVTIMIATLEMEACGAEFGPTETERGFNKELKALKTWRIDERYSQNAIATKQRREAVVKRESPSIPWNVGWEYMRFRRGVSPSYSCVG